MIIEKKLVTQKVIKLASENTEEAQCWLRSKVTDPEFLQRLNSEREYLALRPENLQLYFILEALAMNPAPVAQGLFDELTSAPLYSYPGPYLAALLEASVHVAKPASGLIALWLEQLKPDASELNRTVDVVVANGSAEAIHLFESVLLENKYREDYVIAWFRYTVLRHRQDLMLLKACERLLQSSSWPARLKSFLVEVLFEYQPERWYQIDVTPPKPPARSSLSENSRDILRKIAQLGRDKKIISRKRYIEIQNELSPR